MQCALTTTASNHACPSAVHKFSPSSFSYMQKLLLFLRVLLIYIRQMIIDDMHMPTENSTLMCKQVRFHKKSSVADLLCLFETEFTVCFYFFFLFLFPFIQIRVHYRLIRLTLSGVDLSPCQSQYYLMLLSKIIRGLSHHHQLVLDVLD